MGKLLIAVAFLFAVVVADELIKEANQLSEVTDQQVEEHRYRSYGGYHGGYRGGYGGYRHGRSITDDVQQVAEVEVADVAGAEHRYGGYRGVRRSSWWIWWIQSSPLRTLRR